MKHEEGKKLVKMKPPHGHREERKKRKDEGT